MVAASLVQQGAAASSGVFLPSTSWGSLFPISSTSFQDVVQEYTLIQNNSNNHTNGTNGNDKVPEWFGWIGVGVCILTWGTFVLPMKVKWVRNVEFDPIVFQFYFSLVVCLMSLIVMAWNEFKWSWWAVAGSGIWVPSSLFSIVAVEYLGAAVAQSTWAGCVIITNFIWGVTLFQSKIGNIYLTIFGLVIMIVGIFGTATCSKWNIPEPVTESSPSINSNPGEESIQNESSETTPLYKPENVNINGHDNHDGSIYPSTSEDKLYSEMSEIESTIIHETRGQKVVKILKNSKGYFIGLVAAVLCGITGGSMFVPSRLDEDTGLVYMVAFGIGSFVITTAIMIVYYIYYWIRFKKRVPFHLKLSIFPALTAFLWQTGNFFAYYVSVSPLGLTIGMPLTETAMVITGICGLIFFRELRGWKAILQFFVSVLVLLVPGCILLALFGKAEEVPSN